MNVAIVGIGGYGQLYIDALLGDGEARGVRLVAGVDPHAAGSRPFLLLQDRGIPVFTTLPELYEAGLEPDLVVIASPLHLHADQAVTAMECGSHVLCEKPLAATPADAARMIAARDRTGRMLAVGFQWAFASNIHRLKADLVACRFGRPVSLKTKVYWPRGHAYYGRNRWAGRMRADDGSPVLDSPVNNACAHFIHTMLDLVGDACHTTDWPATVTAELYRANTIENYDTAVFRCRTVGGVELLAAVSHATERTLEPTFEYRFADGRVVSDASTGYRLIATHDNGERVDYGPQPTGYDVDKLWSTIESIRTGRPPAGTAESAAAHTALTAAVQASGTITDFGPAHLAETENAAGVFVPGLDVVLDRCYADGLLPSEFAVPWARAGRTVHVDRMGQPAPSVTLHRPALRPKRRSGHADVVPSPQC